MNMSSPEMTMTVYNSSTQVPIGCSSIVLVSMMHMSGAKGFACASIYVAAIYRVDSLHL